MIPPEVRNPFHTHKADDTVTLPAGDVPELHADALAKCGEALNKARHTGHSAGLLVVGEPGSGKSHMVAQLRQKFGDDPKAALAAIRLGKAFAGRLWRHLRERLVEELLRQYPRPTAGANGLLRILRNRFPRWATAAQGASGGMLEWLLGRSRQADLAPHLDEFAQTCSLDYNLRRVLPQLANPELRSVAYDWLQGKQLGAKDLQRLDLPPVFPSEQEQEVQAQDVVLSFLRLAGDQTTLFLCFDEVEAIQAGTWDAAVLRQFTTLVTELLAEAGPRVVMVSIRPNLLIEVQKTVEVANVQKISQDRAIIPPLSWEQAVRVALSRLEAEPTCRAARLLHPNDSFWPLDQKFLEGVFQQNRRCLTPRHLILACRVEFDRLQKGKPPTEPISGGGEVRREQEEKAAGQLTSTPEEPSPSPAPPTAEEFLRKWEKIRKKQLEKPLGIPFDSVMAIGIPWLVKLIELPYVTGQDPHQGLGDMNLLFQPTTRGQKPVGISFCNHQPQSLWPRLDRLKKQWTTAKGGRLGSLVVLRSDAERTTEKAGQRLKDLEQAGARVIRVDRQQLAELTAFQLMLTAALEGDLTRNGKPVDPPEYDGWAKAHLSEAVKEFFHLVFEPALSPLAPVPAATGNRGKSTAGKK